MENNLEISSIVDTAVYRIDDEQWLKSSREIDAFADQFREFGVLVLEGFIRPSALATLIAESRRLAKDAYFKRVEGNAYLDDTSDDQNLDPDHARRRSDWTRLGVVAYDQINGDSALRQTYESNEVRNFISHIYRKGPLYQYGCSMGALNVSVMEAGDYLRWHFDLSDFVVSIPLQDAEQGGAFEYVHNIRSEGHENYDDVCAVLGGDRSRVKTLEAKPGSLILFQGQYTIHRVSPIKGSTLRLGALLGYVTDPTKGGSDHLRKMRYGRVR